MPTDESSQSQCALLSTSGDGRIEEAIKLARGRYFPAVVCCVICGIVARELREEWGYDVELQKIDPLCSRLRDLFDETSVEQVLFRDSLSDLLEVTEEMDLRSGIVFIARLCFESAQGSLGKSLRAEKLGSYDREAKTLIALSVAFLEDQISEGSVLRSDLCPDPGKTLDRLCTHIYELSLLLEEIGVEWTHERDVMSLLERRVCT